MTGTFTFRIYCTRWGGYSPYERSVDKVSWFIGHRSIRGNCNPRGEPYRYEILHHDGISFPINVPLHLIWLAAEQGHLPKQDVQAKLNQVAQWASICEQNRPDACTVHQGL